MRLVGAEVGRTAVQLQHRVEERFPGSGLAGVAASLSDIAEQSTARTEAIGHPIAWVRVGIGLLVVVLLAGVGATVVAVELPRERMDLLDLIALVESGINDLVFVGIAIAFLATIETRIKRHRALAALHDLRSLAHIIDMHQLTKDPGRHALDGRDTASSPARMLSAFELRRYLDYCSEMLAITGKIAALYVQGFDDQVVLGAVNEVEDLTTGLSRKIWQKIMVLERDGAGDP